MESLKVVATGLEDCTLTISKILKFICNSSFQNLSHSYKISPMESSTSCISIDSPVGDGLSGLLYCCK